MSQHLFISYNHGDSDYVERLAEDLQQRGFDPWYDSRIDYGDRWWRTLDASIQSCAAMIVVMTPEARESEWVEREIMLGLNEKKTIFPLLLNGSCFSILINMQYTDVSQGQLPDAAFYNRLQNHLGTAQRTVQAQPVLEEDVSDFEEEEAFDSGEGFEEWIGLVVDYYDRIQVAGILLEAPLRVGDSISIHGTSFTQKVRSMEIDHQQVKTAHRGDFVGILVDGEVFPNDGVFAVQGDELGDLIGVVTHYYDQIGVAGVELYDTVQVHQTVHFLGDSYVTQSVSSMEIDHRRVGKAGPSDFIGLKVNSPVNIGDGVFKLT